MQMILCLDAQVTMADETSPGTSDRQQQKRSEEKHQERRCTTPSPPDGQILISTRKTAADSSLGSVCVGVNSLPESSDTGILYLNPQVPKWCLVEKFSELSPGDETPLHDDEECSGPELLQCPNYSESSEINGSKDAAQKKERKCSKYLKSHRVKSDPPVKQRASKLKELNVEDYNLGGGGKKTKKKTANSRPVKKSLKKHEEDKIARLLVAMKKRDGVDTEQRPFKCTRCHWAFKKFCNLQSHLQTHTGLKPHVCDICGKAYSHQGTQIGRAHV